LANARAILAAGIAEIAAREACMAAFHAAQAILFERHGAVPRTHSGVHGAFGRLAAGEPSLGRSRGRFLPQAYRHKGNADYAVRRTRDPAAAAEAIDAAADFVAAAEAVLTAGADPAP
jgi:uncharacterized protein (UPF0332 family)